MAPPNPTRPATEPTAPRGKRSAGSVITSVDQDCWPKNAMLNSTMASSTGACVTKKTNGMTAALSPSASLREKFSECRRRAAGGWKTSRPQGSRRRRRHTESRRSADVPGIESAHIVQILGQPEQIKVPGRIAQKLGENQAPTPATKPNSRIQRNLRFAGAAQHLGDCFALARSVSDDRRWEYSRIHQIVQVSPTAPDERRPSASSAGRARARSAAARITAPTAVPALMMPIAVERSRDREPLGHRLGSGRKSAPFAHPQQEAACRQHAETRREPVTGAGERPPHHDRDEPLARPQSVHEFAAARIHQRISQSETPPAIARTACWKSGFRAGSR